MVKRVSIIAFFVVPLCIADCGGGGSTSTANQAFPSSSSLLPATPTVLSSAPIAAGATSPAAVQANPSVTPVPLLQQPGIGLSAPVSNQVPLALGQTATVQASYALSSAQATSLQSARKRHLQYISTSNVSFSVVVTPLGSTASSPYTGSCTTASCTVSFTANPGPTTLAFTLTDAPLGAGNQLASFTTFTLIQPVAISTMTFTANPIVNSVVVQLAPAAVPAGTAANVAVTVNAKDAAGKTIVGSSNYVDVNGNPLTLTLGVTNNQTAGVSAGLVTLSGPTRISAPAQAPIIAHYNGKWLSSATISVTSSQSIAGTITAATLTTTPTVVHEYALGFSPLGLANGPDGNIWIAERSNDAIGSITTGDVVAGPWTTTVGGGPVYIAQGADGNMWFTENGLAKIGKVTPSGALTEFSTTGLARSIVAGPDGNMWFTENNANKVGRVTPAGIVKEFTPPSAASLPYGIARGSDGNLWFAENAASANNIARITPAGVITEFSIPTANASPNGVTAGPDGNVWFVEGASAASRIGRITTSGAINEFSVGISANSAPLDIRPGPDGNLWFTENSAAFGNRIGSITTSGVITEYPITTAGTGPQDLVFGPDGNLWFSESSKTNIGVFVL